MNVISYSLFGTENFSYDNRFEYQKYLLGVYFNARMIKLVYPGWKMYLAISENDLKENFKYLDVLCRLFNVKMVRSIKGKSLCEGMIHRLDPLFHDATHIICRDLDSIVTYREASSVNRWIESGKGYHSINDNTAHAGLMGGLIGIKTDHFKKDFPQYSTFEKLIENYDLTIHGSDQLLIVNRLGNKIYQSLHSESFPSNSDTLPNVSDKYKESNLCINFIGSAGINEMELLRFFRKHDDKKEYTDFEKVFNKICYWR